MVLVRRSSSVRLEKESLSLLLNMKKWEWNVNYIIIIMLHRVCTSAEY